jgi:phosphoglucomutase
MGVAVRRADGAMELLSGNQIGSIMAWYRAERFCESGAIPSSQRGRAALIKTYVTTDLQARIAEHFGLKLIDTLTGFKYIGEKMHEYEKALARADYDTLSADQKRRLLLEHSTFYVFGGEESYGYSGGDYVRDKDANAAVLMFAEVAAWASSRGQSLLDYLDAIYRACGFYSEKLGQLTFEGAAGAAQIQKLLASYRAQPPQSFQGQNVVHTQDFGKEDLRDADGKIIPKETMLMFHLAEGSRMAVRGSGTEPKIKFYFFARAAVGTDLAATKAQTRSYLDRWWDEVQADVQRRIA